jgi:hypothetical protein
VIGVMVPFAPGTLPSFIEDEPLAMCEMSWSLQGAGTAVTVYRRVLPPQTRAPAKEDEATAFEAERAMERVRAVERMEAMGSIEEISGAGCSSGVEMSDAEASGVETGVEAISSTSPRLAVVALTQLDGRHSEAASRLCDGLRRDHVAIVELPPSSRAAIDRMWSCVEEFYTRPLAARQAHGPLHEAEHCDTHLGQPRLVGFTQLSGNACLDSDACGVGLRVVAAPPRCWSCYLREWGTTRLCRGLRKRSWRRKRSSLALGWLLSGSRPIPW